VTADEAKNLMELSSKNKEVIFPYITGSELNQTYIDIDRPTRFAINFFDMALSGEMDDLKNPKGPPYAKDYPDCLNIVENKVKPKRTKKKDNGEFKLRKPLPQKWWQYGDKRPALYSAINGLRRVLVRALTSKHHGMVFLPNGWIYDQSVPVLAFEEFSIYALIQSNIHYEWTICHGSSMKLDPRYTTSDCFETFPFPETTDTLESIGETYYTHRQTIMQTRHEGLTKTYNRFHDPTQTDPDIQTLRDLHIQMDTAVAAAYGWHDLIGPHPLTPSPWGEGEPETPLTPHSLGRGAGGEGGLNHDFHETKQGLRFTISEAARREVLDRLLALNHQRYAEEVAQGLHDKKKAKGRRQKAKGKKPMPDQDQLNLL